MNLEKVKVSPSVLWKKKLFQWYSIILSYTCIYLPASFIEMASALFQCKKKSYQHTSSKSKTTNKLLFSQLRKAPIIFTGQGKQHDSNKPKQTQHLTWFVARYKKTQIL